MTDTHSMRHGRVRAPPQPVLDESLAQHCNPMRGGDTKQSKAVISSACKMLDSSSPTRRPKAAVTAGCARAQRQMCGLAHQITTQCGDFDVVPTLCGDFDVVPVLAAR